MINFNYDFNLISLQSVEKNNFNNDFDDTNCCKIFGVFDDFISPCMNFNSRLNNIKELGDFSAKIGSYHLVYNNENNKNINGTDTRYADIQPCRMRYDRRRQEKRRKQKKRNCRFDSNRA